MLTSDDGFCLGKELGGILVTDDETAINCDPLKYN